MIEARDIEILRLEPGDLIHVALDDTDASVEDLERLAESIERAIEQARPQKDIAVLISDGSIKLTLVRAGE